MPDLPNDPRFANGVERVRNRALTDKTVGDVFATLTRDELLTLGDTELLHRLFHQEEVRLLPERPVSFVCRCSKERVASVLKALGTEEIRGLLADRRTIEVDCDFCGLRYTFSADEAWAALA